jgi:hypothetical protein
MKLNPRAWYVGGALAVLLAGVVGWLLVVKPVYVAASQTLDEAETTEIETERVVRQTKELAVQEKDLQQQIDALMRIRAKIPKDVNIPKLMRTIQAQARAEGVFIDSLQPGQITLFQVERPTPSASASDGGATPDATNKPAPAPTPTDLGQGVAPRDAGVAYVPLTLTGQGTYSSVRRLMSRLEQQQRAFLITVLDVNRQSDDDAKQALDFTMEARVFVLNGEAVSIPTELLEEGE